MADLKCCSECNGVFIKQNVLDICNFCFNKKQKELDKVKFYIEKNKKATLTELVFETGVEGSHIKEWISRGEINITNLTDFDYNCEICYTPTKSSRLCPTCQETVTATVSADSVDMSAVRKIVKK